MIFEKKVESLLNSQKEEVKNEFVEQALKKSSETQSQNGAVKYDTTGDDFVDNFAAISYFKEPRSYEEVDKDMRLLWSVDPRTCLKLAVYIRMITRKPKVVTKDKAEVLDTQKGQGLKHEGIMRLLWLAVNQPATFKANINYFIAAGSWKDIFQMMSFDLQYNGWDNRVLDWNFLYVVINAGLMNPETTHLVRKYLPTIRTNKNCKTIEAQADTIIGRWLAKRMFPKLEKEQSYKAYRKLKSEGVAHSWQQLISKQLYNAINFDKIAGRALSLLVGSKFLENHDLVEKYTKWIEEKPTAKFTGFVFELFMALGDGIRCKHVEKYIESTINAQFTKLVADGKGKENNNSGLLVVRDTSSSMQARARGCNMSAYGIGKAMALYFSEFLKGPFANTFVEFSDDCKLLKWKGETPCDKWVNDKCEAYGSTNFQSVIDLLLDLKEQGVPEDQFPTGLLLVSDGELNPSNSGWHSSEPNDASNFRMAKLRLKRAGFSQEYLNNFKLIMWDIPNNYYGNNSVKFEDFADAPNFFYMSGYDPSAVSFILDNSEFKASPRNARELFNVAMDQIILNKLRVVKPKKK